MVFCSQFVPKLVPDLFLSWYLALPKFLDSGPESLVWKAGPGPHTLEFQISEICKSRRTGHHDWNDRLIADVRFVVRAHYSGLLRGSWLHERFRYDLNIGVLGLLLQGDEQQVTPISSPTGLSEVGASKTWPPAQQAQPS